MWHSLNQLSYNIVHLKAKNVTLPFILYFDQLKNQNLFLAKKL